VKLTHAKSWIIIGLGGLGAIYAPALVYGQAAMIPRKAFEFAPPPKTFYLKDVLQPIKPFVDEIRALLNKLTPMLAGQLFPTDQANCLDGFECYLDTVIINSTSIASEASDTQSVEELEVKLGQFRDLLKEIISQFRTDHSAHPLNEFRRRILKGFRDTDFQKYQSEFNSPNAIKTYVFERNSLEQYLRKGIQRYEPKLLEFKKQLEEEDSIKILFKMFGLAIKRFDSQLGADFRSPGSHFLLLNRPTPIRNSLELFGSDFFTVFGFQRLPDWYIPEENRCWTWS